MSNTLKCPSCGQEIELSEALTHQIQEKVILEERAGFEKKLKEVQKESEEKASKKISEEFSLKLKELREAEEEERERNKKLSEQVSELMKELRESRRKEEDAKVEMEKRLAEEEKKIREEAQKKADEEHNLKSREKDKVIADLQKSLAEATRKAEQGSQQTQGEVLELEIEELLHREFPMDKVEEVKKGVRGADVIQVVIDKRGRTCGTILYESKNAAWSNGWIAKLKEDARSAKAHIPVLVATNPPEDVTSFSYIDGVWVVKRSLVLALATALRYNLVVVNDERVKNVNKQEKSEVLYQYMTSHEFRGRIEAIVEAFTAMQDEIEREKRWFQTKWNRQEKHIRSVIDHTHGMYGDIQGVIGKSLPNISTLELPE